MLIAGIARRIADESSKLEIRNLNLGLSKGALSCFICVVSVLGYTSGLQPEIRSSILLPRTRSNKWTVSSWRRQMDLQSIKRSSNLLRSTKSSIVLLKFRSIIL